MVLVQLLNAQQFLFESFFARTCFAIIEFLEAEVREEEFFTVLEAAVSGEGYSAI